MCGIYGIINNGQKPFRRDIFTALGIINDRRGGDSCGVFIDDKVEYGIGKRALFEDFFWDCDLLNEIETCEVALGHDRKASVGGVTVEKAHPILHKNEEGKTDFVLVHNGTIHNYEALAKEYIPNFNCTGLSDSQVLTLILYYKGFDVLEKYNGGAAFVAVDYRKGFPETYMFKGASKLYYSGEEQVERPLYFSYSTEGLIFSSIASMLCALVDNNVYEVKNNKLYKYVHGKLYTIRTINRSYCQQNKVYTPNYNYNNSGTNTVARNLASWFYIKYDETTNRYIHEKDSKYLHGKYCISSYGRIMESGEKLNNSIVKVYNIFFFNGIPFRDKFSYNQVNKKFKKSHQNLDDFTKSNITLIRFYSADKMFIESHRAYISMSETGYAPFTGSTFIIGKGTLKWYDHGVYDKQTYVTDYDELFRKAGFVPLKEG